MTIVCRSYDTNYTTHLTFSTWNDALFIAEWKLVDEYDEVDIFADDEEMPVAQWVDGKRLA